MTTVFLHVVAAFLWCCVIIMAIGIGAERRGEGVRIIALLGIVLAIIAFTLQVIA